MKRRLLLAGGVLAGLMSPVRADVRGFGRGAWPALLAAHRGRRAIVHFWGITCGPCLAELPAWGAFLRRHADAPLVLIAADPAPQPAEALAAVLDRAGLSAAESWRFDGGFADRLYYEVDPDWQGELPRTTLLIPDGVQDSWLGETDFPRLDRWLAAS
jgi:thiol-disulfide isomerase/thioredoxin